MGKANPKKKHESLTLAELLGPQALCMHNPFREPLLLRMHLSARRFIWDTAALPVPSGTLEVTLLEEDTDPIPDTCSGSERTNNG